MMTIRIHGGYTDNCWEILQNFKKDFPRTFNFLRNFPKDFVLNVCFEVKDKVYFEMKDSEEPGKYVLSVWEEGQEINESLMEFIASIERKKIMPRWDGGRFALDKAEDIIALSWLKNWAMKYKKLIDEITNTK